MAGCTPSAGRGETYTDYPRVEVTCAADGGQKAVDVVPKGYFRYIEEGRPRAADLEIQFSAHTRYVPAVEAVAVGFTVDFGADLSGVQVLRWPAELYGTDSPMDTARRVAYTPGEQNSFTAEPGYLYAVYLTWEDCFMEYPFLVGA